MITALVLLYPVGEEGQYALDYVDYDIIDADVTYDMLGLISELFIVTRKWTGQFLIRRPVTG